MIIDFHTHIYPDKLAGKVLPVISKPIGLSPSTDGTASGQLKVLKETGIDLAVILPVATAPHQFESILRFGSRINESAPAGTYPRLLSFAGIHPDSPDIKGQLRLIKREGFKGIKLHPNYQNTHFDDIRYKRIICEASSLGLIQVIHTGYDPSRPDAVFCSCDMILNVLRELKPENMVLAHMGNNDHYEESYEKLCGQDVFFDTSFAMLLMEQKLFLKMIRRHGRGRILFGSDAPWASQKESAALLSSLPGLTEEEKEMIFSGNARTLLGI